ncbi:right-handed parallel beta-helix repeat-containing protein [Rapidithrix thailandica]|uniref:Right-handed parallel beta-helix repeat-containing protein n=1 Tax=Rapidithrix thailandica TaxID=413964 RepID=A0AAW9SDM4_9BACT
MSYKHLKNQSFYKVFYGVWGAILLFCCLSVKAQQMGKTLSIEYFGAKANDDRNDAEALRKAAEYCRKSPGTTLRFPPGRYDFRDEKAVSFMKDVLAGKMGKNPEKVIFTPYYPYIKGLDFTGAKNITLEAEGAELYCEGWMEPISLEYCENITIKGLTIDYKHQPHSEGKVLKVKKGYMEVEFDRRFPVQEDMVVTRIMFWDTQADRLLPYPIYFPEQVKLVSPQTLRIYSEEIQKKHKKKIALLNHSFHFRPAILIHESRDTYLENVTIHAQPGMGIVGHRSHNVTMKGLRVVPREGHYQSTNTDATHFTSCTGLIRFDGCQFKGQGDDATNIHNYYNTITRRNTEKVCEVAVKTAYGTHAQVLDYPDVGDKMELVDKMSLKKIRVYNVLKVEKFDTYWKTRLTLDKALPENIEEYYLINSTRLPKVEMVHCNIQSHLARAVLIKTRNVLIEHNTFQNTTGTGIHIGAEGDWQEGVAAADVVVRNNRIIHCGRGDGTQNGACGITVNVKAENTKVPGLHKRLLFEHNIIEGENAECGIFISGAEDVTIRNNEISGCKEPVKVQYSTKVMIDGKPVPEEGFPSAGN